VKQTNCWKGYDMREKFDKWLKENGMTEMQFLDKVREGIVAQYCATEEELGEMEKKEANLRFVTLPVYTPIADKMRRLGWDKEKVNEALRRACE
jgi:hypothetical protein